MIALDTFRQRWRGWADKLATAGFVETAEPHESPAEIDEACVAVVVAGHGRRGQLTVWASGETDIEISADGEERVLLHQFRVIEAEPQLDEILDAFAAGMQSATLPPPA